MPNNITFNQGRNMGQVISYLFKKNEGLITNLKINIYHYLPAEDGKGFTYLNTIGWSELTKTDLAKIYEQIILEREEILTTKNLIDLMLKIELFGKLDGITIKEIFEGIDNFCSYLENKSIIVKPSLILKNSS